MLNNILFKIKKFRGFLGKIFMFSAQHIALTCVFLFFISLALGGLVFLKYIVLAKNVEPESSGYFHLNEGVYNSVLNTWQEEEIKFNQANNKQWIDFFNRPVIIEVELTE